MSKMTRLFGGAVFAVVLLLGAGSLPVQAEGLKQDQIDAIILLLTNFGVTDQSIINNVKTALNGTTSTTSSGGTAFCYNFNTDITFGNSNATDINALQTALSKENLINGIQYSFTETVAAAVSGFQEKYAGEILTPNGLTHGTGYVGSSTRAKLNKLYGCSNQTTTTTTTTTTTSAPTTAINGSCTLPWRGTIESGSSTLAYFAPTVVSPATCLFQTRYCSNGTFVTGTYTNKSCVVTSPVQQPAVSCSLPWGETIESGSSTLAYFAPTVVSPATCLSQTLYCNNGTFVTGTYKNQSCEVITPAPVYTPPADASGKPNVSSISNSSTNAGDAYDTKASIGSTVYVYGTNFVQGVYIGVDGPYGTTIPASSITVKSPTVLSFVVPSLTIAMHSIMVVRDVGDFVSPSVVWMTVTSPTSQPAPIAGVCGTAAKTYAYSSSNYGSDTQCAKGSPSNSNITFPSAGSSVSWSCSGTPSQTCTASQSAAPVLTFNFYAVSNPIPYGTRAQLSWSSSNASSCDAVNWSNRLPVSGDTLNGRTETDILYTTTKFELQCASSVAGTVRKSVTVTVNSPPSCTLPTSLGGGTIESDNYVTAFKEPFVAGWLGFCMSEKRTCTNGSLSGSYGYKTCALFASALSAVEGLVADNSASQTQASFQYVWNNDLQIGSSYSADISALQTALTKEGVYAGEITGGFYNQTFTAVKAFQQKYGIKITGYVGAITRTKLNALY